jgi:hypothetical protein
MFKPAHSCIALFSCVIAMGCGSTDNDEPIEACPAGTVRSGNICVPSNDGGTNLPGPDGSTPETGEASVPETGGEEAARPDANPTPLLPLVVDDWFFPSGYMGDGASAGVSEKEACFNPRPGEGKGKCHEFTWTPGANKWAGVFWQYPDNNWGALPGLEIPKGAAEVCFYAWGAKGGELIKFVVGMKDADGFEKSSELTLTTDPKQYCIDLSGVAYTDVIGAFAWFAGSESTSPVTFSLDDIQWR